MFMVSWLTLCSFFWSYVTFLCFCCCSGVLRLIEIGPSGFGLSCIIIIIVGPSDFSGPFFHRFWKACMIKLICGTSELWWIRFFSSQRLSVCVAHVLRERNSRFFPCFGSLNANFIFRWLKLYCCLSRFGCGTQWSRRHYGFLLVILWILWTIS